MMGNKAMKQKSAKVGLSIGEPVIVAQAPPEVKDWGQYQFPTVERLADGALHVEYSLELDSATSYGLPGGHAISRDEGQTWTPVRELPAPGGLLLPNGDRLRADCIRSRPVAELSLPAPLTSIRSSYTDYDYYAVSTLPPDLVRAWPFLRYSKGGADWQREWATVTFSQVADVRDVTEKVFVCPHFYHPRLRVASDGTLRSVLCMPQLGVRNRVLRVFATVVVSSADNGRTWREVGVIPYQPDLAADPHWDGRDGFSEPELQEMPDGSLLCLLRTDDGNGTGPMYWARSEDQGVTWSRPAVFDDRGVWAQMLTLESGVTLASYGRLGLFVRATRDSSGRQWDDRVTIVEPDVVSGLRAPDTCAYSGLIALSDTRALLVYSYFKHPDAQGRPCKTLLSRLIEVRA